jgi:CubicO group peptidase (beta-lactamase class C family)
MQMLLNGGKYNGHQILGKRTVEMITSGQLKEGLFGDDNMGLGFGITSEKSAAKEPRNAGSFSWEDIMVQLTGLIQNQNLFVFS